MTTPAPGAFTSAETSVWLFSTAGNDLARGNLITERLTGLHDDPRKTRGGSADTVQVEANSPIDFKDLVQFRRSSLRDLHARLRRRPQQ